MEWSFPIAIDVLNGHFLCQPCFPVCGIVFFSAFMCDIKVGTKVYESFLINMWMLLLMSRYDSFA